MPTPITAVRLCRTLPIHELNARRARKQALTRLPALQTAPPLPAQSARQSVWVPGWSIPLY